MATLAGGFGVLALLLACVGLYGLLAYRVAQRTKEIGIRMAVGAQRAQVVTLILKGATRLVVAGIVIGLPAAWMASRWIESMLFGLTAERSRCDRRSDSAAPRRGAARRVPARPGGPHASIRCRPFDTSESRAES